MNRLSFLHLLPLNRTLRHGIVPEPADVCPLHASADILVAITNVLSPVSAAASVVYPALFTALIFTM